MRFHWAAAAGALLMCGAGQTGYAAPVAISGPTVAVGMICNTAEQADQFLKLRVGGSEAQQAMQDVNKQANDPQACGVAAIAFIRDATIESKPLDDKLLQVVRVHVVAGFNGTGWQRVSGVIQYAVVEGKGVMI